MEDNDIESCVISTAEHDIRSSLRWINTRRTASPDGPNLCCHSTWLTYWLPDDAITQVLHNTHQCSLKTSSVRRGTRVWALSCAGGHWAFSQTDHKWLDCATVSSIINTKDPQWCIFSSKTGFKITRYQENQTTRKTRKTKIFFFYLSALGTYNFLSVMR